LRFESCFALSPSPSIDLKSGGLGALLSASKDPNRPEGPRLAAKQSSRAIRRCFLN
jgi:hypothetical protein